MRTRAYNKSAPETLLIPPLFKRFSFFANRNTPKNMQPLDESSYYVYRSLKTDPFYRVVHYDTKDQYAK